MNCITFSYPNLITGELLSSLLLCQSPSGSTFRRMPVAKPSCCHQIVSTRADAAAGHWLLLLVPEYEYYVSVTAQVTVTAHGGVTGITM